jgi:hypothetical protein
MGVKLVQTVGALTLATRNSQVTELCVVRTETVEPRTGKLVIVPVRLVAEKLPHGLVASRESM